MSSFPGKPKLLSDENVSKAFVETLNREGFDIMRSPQGASDREVASLASSEKRVLISFDRHFGNALLFPPQDHEGIIFIRINPSSRQTVVSALLKMLGEIEPSQFKGHLFVLSAFGFRKYPK
jgi:predicted nuclease of predicted toxin-antitoxin system